MVSQTKQDMDKGSMILRVNMIEKKFFGHKSKLCNYAKLVINNANVVLPNT